MIDAYKIGVSIGLHGNVVRIIEELVEQFAKLDKAIQRTQGEVNSLVSGMRAIAREGKTAAQAWQAAATAIERAANASRRSQATAAGRSNVGGGASFGAAAGIVANAGRDAEAARRNNRPLPQIPYYNYNRPTPYARIQDSNTGRVYEGEVIPPSGAAGGPGGPPAPYGTTINGTAGRPGGPTYGPYGTPFGEGLGGSGGGRGQGGFPGGGQGGAPGGPGGGRRMPRPSAFHAAIGDWAGLEAAEGIFEPTFEYQRILTQLKAMPGFDDKSLRAADEQAERVRRAVPGSSRTQNLELIGKLMSLTQNPEEAINAIEPFAQLQIALDGLKPGTGDSAVKSLYAAAQTGEYRGVLTKLGANGKPELDLGRLNEFIHFATSIAYVSHGTVGVEDLLKMVRAAGPEGRVMSYRDIAESIAMQQAMSSQKFGTALQAYGREYLTGRMAQGVYHLLQSIGITSKDPTTWSKLGIGHIMMLPGAMTPEMNAKAGSHPIEFMNEELIPRVQKFIEMKYPKEWNDTKGLTDEQIMEKHTQLLIKGTSMISSTDPIARLFAEVLSTQLQQQRDLFSTAKLEGRDPYTWKPIPGAQPKDFYGLQESDNPIVKIRELRSAWESLMITIGKSNLGPVVKTLDDIAHVLDTLNSITKNHPTETRVALDSLVAGLVAFNAAVALTGIAKGINLLRTAGQALGGFAAGGAAAAGLRILVGPIGLAALGVSITELLARVIPGLSIVRKIDAAVPLLDRIDKWAFGEGAGAPRAPAAPIGQQGASGGSAPVRVHIDNPQDLVHGIAGGLSNNLNRPPSGVTGHDSSMDAVNAMYGGIP